MAINTIWQEEFTVKSSETDFQARLKISNIFTWMQDVAANHATALGLGYQELLKQEKAWIMSRKKVQFYDFPHMGEKVTVQTWPKGIQQKLFFMRDHQLNGADGRLLAQSTTAYVLISTQARRILPPTMLDMPIPDNNGKSAIAEALDKIPAVDGLKECFSIQAGYSMADLMGHVNNVRYIDWISDCFPIAEYQDRRPSWLQVNYINEIMPGEKVRLLRAPYPDGNGRWYITGMNQTSGARAFEAVIQWPDGQD